MAWTALLPIASGALSLLGANSARKQQERWQDRSLQQSERQYNEREPLRRLGMTALGQIEAPMDLGNLGFNPANPFAAARGPAPSTASYGDWGRMTYSPDTVRQAADPMRPVQDEVNQFAAAAAQQKGMVGRLMQGAARKAQAQVEQRRGMQALGPTGYGWER